MQRNLNARVETLEALPVMARVDKDAEAARQQRADNAHQAHIERLENEKAEYASLDAAGRIQHWLKKIHKAEAYLAAYSDHPPPVEGGYRSRLDESIDHSFWKLELKITRDNLSSTFQFELAAASVDRLAELNYDNAKIGAWRVVLERYRELHWQWRPEYVELPDDALALLNQKKAKKRVCTNCSKA